MICPDKEQSLAIGMVRSSFGRNSAACNRPAGPKVLLCALVLVLGASVGRGQWLEKVIYLPDSLSGVLWPSCMASNPDAHKVYVSSSYHKRSGSGLDTYVLVVDADTLQKLARIHVQEVVASLCYNPITHKLYASHRMSGNGVSVIDGFSDSVIATVTAGSSPDLMCCNTVNGKVYASSHETDDSLTVIDGAGDSVIRSIPVAGDQWSLTFDSLGNRLYCGHDTLGYSGLLVIDGAADTVVAEIPVPFTVMSAVVSRKHRRLYCSGLAGDSLVLLIISTDRDSIEGSIPAGGEQFCINELRDELYFQIPGDTITALDCSGDTVARRLAALPDVSFACLPERDRLICTAGDKAYLLDLADGSIAAGPSPAPGGPWLLLDEAEARLYAVRNHVIGAIDANADSIVRSEMAIGSEPWLLCVATKANKVYAGDGARGAVYSLDCASGRTSTIVLEGSWVHALCYDALDNKVYCSSEGRVYAIDCATDSVVATCVTGSPMYMTYIPERNRVYVANTSTVSAIDCRNDSIICRIQMHSEPYCPAYNPERDEVMIPCVDGVAQFVAVVDCSTNVWVDTLPYETAYPIYCQAVKKMYMVGANTGDLPVLDGASDSLLTTINGIVGGGGGVNETDCKVYTLGYLGDRFIGIVDAKADTVTRIITTIPTPISMTRDILNDRVYITSAQQPGWVFVLDGRTDDIIDSVPVRGHLPYRAVWNPRDGRVYVCNQYSGSISVLRDSMVPGVQDRTRATSGFRGATITHQVDLPSGVRQADVYDITGRKVARLGPGSDNLSPLGVGVYFVRTASSVERSAPSVAKVVVVR